MKKILAIFLALIMILSVALVACQKDATTTSGGGSDDEDDDLFLAQNSKNTTGEDDDDDDKKTGGWEAAAYPIYCMALELNVRDKDSTTGVILGTIKIGEKVDAVERNDDWYKISYQSGKDGFAYVSADYVTIDASEATFTDLTTPETLVIKDDPNNTYGEKGRSVNLRKHPIFDGDDDYITIYRTNTQNNELKKVATNGKGNIWEVTYNNSTYYIGSGAFKHFEGYNASTGGVG